jgi:hypothetical protein
MRTVVELRQTADRVVIGEATDVQLGQVLETLPPLAKLAHPIIRHFEEAFAGTPDARESITGLKNPHWWKQKTGRWRGAATDHAVVGPNEAWLCAAGIRAGGEKTRDFYNVFMSSVGRGAPYLPTEADRAVVRVARKLDVLSAWRLQVYTSVLVKVHAAHRHENDGVPVEIPVPSTTPNRSVLATIIVDVDIVEEGDERVVECSLTMRPIDHARPDLLLELALQARVALAIDADSWRLSPLPDGALLYSADIDQATLDLAARTAAGEPVVPAPAHNFRIGTVAHYSKRDGLTEASVEGRPVPALCGHWMVPIHDFVGLPVCPTCAAARDELS